MPKETGRQKPDTESVAWRLSKPMMERARAEAKQLGLSITAFINFLLLRYFDEKDGRS